MEKQLIKEMIKVNKCPNCEIDENYGQFERVRIVGLEDKTLYEEECPSCGTHIIHGDNVEAHSMTLEELYKFDNRLKKLMLACPELNEIVRDKLNKNVQVYYGL